MAGAKRHPMSPEDNWLLRRVTDPQVSPNGTGVAHTVTRNDKASNERQPSIRVASMDGRRAARGYGTSTTRPKAARVSM